MEDKLKTALETLVSALDKAKDFADAGQHQHAEDLRGLQLQVFFARCRKLRGYEQAVRHLLIQEKITQDELNELLDIKKFDVKPDNGFGSDGMEPP